MNTVTIIYVKLKLVVWVVNLIDEFPTNECSAQQLPLCMLNSEIRHELGSSHYILYSNTYLCLQVDQHSITIMQCILHPQHECVN